MIRTLIFAGAALLAVPLAAADETQARLTPSDIEALAQGGAGAGTSGLAGIRTTVLSGDPAKPGLYTIRLTVPANTVIAAHDHADTRSAVVISGIWYFGYGAKHDEAALKALPPGSFYTEPPGDPHFARTGADPVTLYITGTGPTDTTYVDPKDTPAAK